MSIYLWVDNFYIGYIFLNCIHTWAIETRLGIFALLFLFCFSLVHILSFKDIQNVVFKFE